MAAKTISINPAPVLTLWAAVVAERLGFEENEARSLGKALAGPTAQSNPLRGSLVGATRGAVLDTLCGYGLG